MTTNRTQNEILVRIEEIKKDDFFGFETSDLIEYLSFENAKQYLKDNVTKEQYNEDRQSIVPKVQMIDYMPFAWEKANNFRGLSASRSMSHYRAWLWLDGDNELWKTLEDYQYYGKDKLVEICKYLGIDASQWDDGIRKNSESEE